MTQSEISEGNVCVYLEYKHHTELIAILRDEAMYDSMLNEFTNLAIKEGAELTESIK